ncbi:MAG: DUF742 domain-containing protein [Akkermansiaceae bacterium]|nr:DUF742 domain-containing protein [Akkermansiaceae bacterium]
MTGDWLPSQDDTVEPVVRPFVLTRGRTASQLPVEALCMASNAALAAPATLSQEELSIVMLCSTPHSVAEISAAMALPLGVCRVLVGDLVQRDLVFVSQTMGIDVDLDLIGRLLDGIRQA